MNYHCIGAVRTKPGRGDPTLSLSCSDKIAKWNAIGWQGALLSFFIPNPITMEGIICGGESYFIRQLFKLYFSYNLNNNFFLGGCPYSKQSFHRAVNERVFQNVPIYQSEVNFPDIKIDSKKPCSLSIIWCKTSGTNLEVSVNGYKQGVTKKNLNKKEGRTSICKKELFLLFEETFKSFPENDIITKNIFNENKFQRSITYYQLKMAARNYQDKWSKIKNNYFKIWSKKPDHLLDFTLEEN